MSGDKMADMLFRDVEPASAGMEPVADCLAMRMGLKRKESKANHGKLLIELIRFRKSNYPVEMDDMARILGVSVPQAYEEIRKWKALGLIEKVKIPSGDSYISGYMLSSATANRLVDRLESTVKSFLRKTRRIAKELDDMMATENLRKES